jgi:hypothetical protein
MTTRTLSTALAALAAAAVHAQAPAPSPSPSPAALPAAQRERRAPDPRETVVATLKGKKVSIDYGRPALRGRTIDALLGQLPEDRVWRAGVNQVTTLTTETDLLIGGKRVPAGKYSVYVHAPASGDWSLILNSDPGVPLKTIFPAAPPEVADALWPRLRGYAEIAAQEVARVPLKKAAAKEPMERFLISLDPAVNGQSALHLTWGGQAWTVDVKPAA